MFRRQAILSASQNRVMDLLGKGQSNVRIADQLNVTKKVVDNHIYRIFKRLGVSNRHEAIMFCYHSENVSKLQFDVLCLASLHITIKDIAYILSKRQPVTPEDIEMCLNKICEQFGVSCTRQAVEYAQVNKLIPTLNQIGPQPYNPKLKIEG